MAKSKSYYEVIVGNIGRVYEGNNAAAARAKYNSYVKASKAKYGRASGEQVSLWKDGDIIAEHDETEPGYTSNPRGRRKVKNNPSTFIPLRGIRRTSDGGIQILAPHGTLSNPAKKRGFLKKVERLFSSGSRGIRKALGNPKNVKYHKIPEGWLAVIYTPNGIVKGIGDTKLQAAIDARKMIHK